MAITGIIRVGYQTSDAANNETRVALTGTKVAGAAEAPFRRIATATYSCENAADTDVAAALVRLAAVLQANSTAMDSVMVSLVKNEHI